MDLVLNNLQRLICHKIQPTNEITVTSAAPSYLKKERFGSIPIDLHLLSKFD